MEVVASLGVFPNLRSLFYLFLDTSLPYSCMSGIHYQIWLFYLNPKPFQDIYNNNNNNNNNENQ